MRKIKYIILLITCGLFISTVSKATSEAEFVKLLKEYTYQPDGSLEFHCNKILKINAHMAFNNLYGETFIVYNPDFQTLKINESYTRQADGTIVKTPQNAFNEVLPAQADGAPFYNGLKEMVVTHTGLELGATIYLDYTLSSKPTAYSLIDIDEILQEMTPVKEYVLIINIPQGRDLNYTLTNMPQKPLVTEQNGIKQYRWVFKNIPAASRESFQPRHSENKPRFIASDRTDCKEALNTLSQLTGQKLNEANITFVRSLTNPMTTEREKVFTLQNYVVDQVKTVDLSLENTAYQVRNPDEILNTSYGTALEKTNLFIAMLKAIDLEPELMVIYPGYLKNQAKGLKPVSQFKVKVNADKHPLFLSAVYQPSESLELRGGKDEIWLLSTSAARPLTVMETKGNIDYQIHMSISPNSATVKGIIDIKGGLLPMGNKKSLESCMINLAKPFGDITESQISSGSPIDYRLNFSARQPLKAQNNYILYNLPEAVQGIKNWQLLPLNSKRNSPLEIPCSLSENYDYILILEPGIKFKGKPLEIKRQNKVGSLSITIRQEDNIVKIQKELQLNKNTVAPSEYEDFRKLITDWADPRGEKLILEVSNS